MAGLLKERAGTGVSGMSAGQWGTEKKGRTGMMPKFLIRVGSLVRGVVAAAALLAATPHVAAPLEVESYLTLRQSTEQFDMDILNLWIDGMVDGIQATNLVLEMKKMKKLYCKPKLTRDTAYQIIDHKIQSRKYRKDTPVNILFLFGLMEEYPCN